MWVKFDGRYSRSVIQATAGVPVPDTDPGSGTCVLNQDWFKLEILFFLGREWGGVGALPAPSWRPDNYVGFYCSLEGSART